MIYNNNGMHILFFLSLQLLCALTNRTIGLSDSPQPTSHSALNGYTTTSLPVISPMYHLKAGLHFHEQWI
jgi:hypothetical protein